MKNKYSRLRLILLLYTSIIFVLLVSLGAVWTNNYISEKKNNRNTSEHVQATLGYDLVDAAKKIDVGSMIFGEWDDQNLTCTFLGLRSFDTGSKVTLEIPDKIKVVKSGSNYDYPNSAGVEYTVTKFDTLQAAQQISGKNYSPYGYDSSNHHEVTSLFYYGSHITALIIPDTVETITPAALYGLASLEYLKTPFIGENKTSRNSLHSMFSLGYNNTSNGTYQYPYIANIEQGISGDPAYKTTQDGHQLVPAKVEWYDTVQTSNLYYWVPCNLHDIVVTKQEAIGNRTFIGCKQLKSVELPNTLVRYEKGAISEEVTEHGYTFAECTALERVVLSENMSTLPIGMFSNCQNLDNVIIPKNTQGIPKNFFGGCIRLKKIYMPTGITQIGSLAFSNCEQLADIQLYEATKDCIPENYVTSEFRVALPAGLLKIENEAFASCHSIKDLVIPQGVVSIGASAFNSMITLETLTIPFVGTAKEEFEGSTPDQFVFGYMFGTSSNAATYSTTQNGTTYYIPNSLTTVTVLNASSIKAGAFENLSKNTVTGVKTIEVNSSCQYIAPGAFAGTQTLTDLILPFAGFGTNGTSQGRNGYFTSIFGTGQKEGLEAQGHPDCLRQVPVSLKNIVITHQNEIYTNTFYGLKYIKSVEIYKDYTTQIDEQIFYQNDSLETIILPFVGRNRGEFYERWWWWRDVQWRNTLGWAFSSTYHSGTYGCDVLRYYDSYRKWIPLTLKNVTITDESSIGTYSFRYFTSVENLTIKQNRSMTISESACYYMSNLQSISLPFLGADANRNGNSGRTHTVGFIFGTDEYPNSYGAYEYSTFQIPKSLKSVTIDNLPAVTANSFRGLTSVESVTLNEKVNSIYDYAFYGCENLSKINYKTDTDFSNVGDYAFYNCKKINKILTAIPRYANTENVNLVLGDYSFARTSISTIDFTKIQRVGKYAFSGCLNITSVNVTENAEVSEGLFKDCSFLTDFTLAQGKARSHMFENCISLVNANIVTATLSDYIIPDYMFAGCTNLIWGGVDSAVKGLVISNQTKEIGEGAFKDCISIDNFLIPNQTVKIGAYALNGITKFDSIVIPRNCTTIKSNVFTENIGHGFKIWVYDKEDDWPSTWVENWNCVNPVYVIPGIDDSIYEFAFSAELNGYIITGLKDAVKGTLSGKINLPKQHNAVDVVGIVQDVFHRESISKVVVPSTYRYFGYTSGTEANVFGNGKRVDVYFETTVKNARETFKFVKAQNDDYVLDESHPFVIFYDDPTGDYSEKKFTDCGFVFYQDYWQYGTKNSEDAITPYARVDKLSFELDPTPMWYDNTKHEPAVLHAYLNCAVVPNDTVEILSEGEIPTTLFNYTYSDNIFAGQGKVEATLNSTNYNTYKTSTKGQLLLSGSCVTKFTIRKSPIKVYYTESTTDRVTEFNKTYDEDFWKVSATTWGNAELIGLPDGYTISGVLATRGVNAGTYTSASNGFRWDSDYVIRYKGVDVTSNFTIELYLRVIIKPMKVRIVWDNCEYDQIGQIYSYQYTGDIILPQAKVVDLSGREVEACSVSTENIAGRGVFPSSTEYEGFAWLTRSNGNYELESYNYTHNARNGMYQKYKIVNRKVTITINNPNYVMGINDDSYIFTNFKNPGRTVVISGIQEGSTLLGKIVTLANGLSAANLEGEVYTTEAERIDFESKMFDLRDYHTGPDNCPEVDGTPTPTLPYLIYRNETNGNLRVENDYYDITITGSVTINYNKFEIEYLMDMDTENEELLTLTPTANVGEYTTTFEVDGLDHILGVRILNEILTLPDSAITIQYVYPDGANTYIGPNPPTIKKVNTEYLISVRVTRKNFTDDTKNITIRTVKSNIRYDETVLNKEYDGKPVNLFNDMDENIFITKQAKEWDAINSKWNYLQTFTYEWLVKDTQGNFTSLGTDPKNGPVEPGTNYYLHLTATGTEYFNEFDQKIPFTISKRILYVFVDKFDPFDNASSSATNMVYTGSPYVKTINTSVSGSRGRLLGMENDPDYGFSDTRHIFVGTFQTRSQYPQTYYSSEANDFVWSTPWKVYSTGGRTTGDVTRFYQIVFVNDFDIIPRTIVYEVSEPYDGVYDGIDHTIDITVSDPELPNLYTIYYSLEEANATNDEGAPWSLNKPKFVSPGVYTIWYKIEAGRIPGANEESQYRFYYYTEYGQKTITIRELTFDILPPDDFIKDDSENPVTDYYINYDAHNHSLECTVTNNPFAEIRYTLIYKETEDSAGVTRYSNTTDVIYVRERGFYTLIVTVSGTNFTTKTVEYTFRITEENLEDLVQVSALPVNVEYDGAEHSIDVVVGDIDETRYRIAYSVDDEDHYSYTKPKFTDCCDHVIYYRIEPIFDKAYTYNYKIYEGHARIIIYESTMTGITIVDYNAPYDGEYHTITINGLEDNPLYTGAVVYYTTTFEATYLPVTSSAWSTTCPSYKDVTGAKTIYIRIVLKNYNDFAASGSVTITKLLNPTATYDDLGEIDFAGIDVSNYSSMKITTSGVEEKFFDATRTVQYSKAPLVFSALNIKTNHDGNIIVKYYNAVKTAQGEYTYTEEDLLLDPPMSLGTYYYVVEYRETLNCAKMIVEGGFDLVPRVLRINYTEEVEYDGSEHGPAPTVVTGTSDVLYIIADRVDGKSEVPVEIGEYQYDFKFSENQTNYVIHPDDRRITFKITKRKLLVKFTESKDYAVDEPWFRDSDWTISNGYSFVNKLLNGHVFHATMYTSSYAKATYVYSTLSGEASIYDVKVKDVYITDADDNDVTHLYDISYDIIVNIVYPTLDYQVKPFDGFYDGERHTIEFVLKDSDRDKVTIKYLGDDNLYHETPVTFVECGEYVVKYWIDSDVYQDVFGQSTVTIRKTRLEFNVFDDDYTYDDYDKFAHYEATNVVGLTPSDTHVFYFKKSEVTYEQLDALFSDFNEDNALYKSVYEKYALGAMHNAGEYFIVVHYNEENNWFESYKIVDGLIRQKPIYFTLAANRTPYITNYNTNGFKYDEVYHTIALGDATFLITDLVPNHQMRMSTQVGVSTTYRCASIYSVRTVSPNAGSYYGTHYVNAFGDRIDEYGFEFDRMIIIDAYRNDVTENYCPVFDDSQLQVVINRIPLTKFDVTDATYEYNGLDARPNIDTPSDGELTFTYYKMVGGVPYAVDEAKDVGTYLVKVRIAAGTNFEAWPKEEEAYVTIVPKEVNVVWENGTQDFTGDYLKPDAYFINIYDQRIDLSTTVYYYGDFHDEGAINADLYEAYVQSALFTDENYHLNNVTTIFSIRKISFNITVNGDTIVSDAVWQMLFDETLEELQEQNFPEGLKITDTTGQVKAVLQTIDRDGGYYQGNSKFKFNIKVTNKYGDDVTNSVTFNVLGKVYINSHVIKFNLKDDADEDKIVHVEYDPAKEYSIEDYIQITNPTASLVTIKYNEDGSDNYDTPVPSYKHAGSYYVKFQLTAAGYDTTTGEITLVIEPRNPYINFSNTTFNKTYDGTPITRETILSAISKFECNGTPSFNDLTVEFYMMGAAVPLVNDPVNAGQYRVVITCNKDGVEGVPQDYKVVTPLVDIAFEISRVVGTVVFTLDKEITGMTEFDWLTSGETISFTNGVRDLTTGVRTAQPEQYDQTANKVKITNYQEYGFNSDQLIFNLTLDSATLRRGTHFLVSSLIPTIKYIGDVYTVETNNKVVENVSVDPAEGLFVWNVFSTTLKEPADETLFRDMTSNYTLSVNVEVNIHLPYANIVIEDVDVEYDGAYHHGTINWAASTPSSLPLGYKMFFADNPTDLRLRVESSLTNTIEDVKRANPGTTTVYYYFILGEDYEAFSSSYDITIDKLIRDYTFTVADKEYDGQYVGTYNYNSKYYLPDWVNNKPYPDKAPLPDDPDIIDKIVVKYQKVGTTLLKTEVRDAGTYRVFITIPETDNYQETIIDDITFTITRRKMYLSGSYSTGYTGSNIFYNNFGASNPYFRLFVIEDDQKKDITASEIYVSSTTIQTTDSIFKTYNGADNEVKFLVNNNRSYSIFESNGQKVENVTGNYELLLSGDPTHLIEPAKITITRGQFSYRINGSTQTYTGTTLSPSVSVLVPLNSNNTIIEYSLDKTDETSWQSQRIGFIETGSDYTIYARIRDRYDNYDEEIVTINFVILPKQTELSFNVPDKEYDGNPVLPPQDFVTNLPQTKLNQIMSQVYKEENWSYYVWDEYNQNWHLCEDYEVPLNAGRYKLVIEVTQDDNDNYTGGTFEDEFTISKVQTRINWTPEPAVFVYNGETQKPTAVIADIKNNQEFNYNYENVVQVAEGDITSTDVGVYEITVRVEYKGMGISVTDNYDIAPESYTVRYVIKQRPVTISINRSVKFDSNKTFSFNYNEKNLGGTLIGYTATGLVDGHTLDGSVLTTARGSVGPYTDPVTDFTWLSAGVNPQSYAIVYEDRSKEVTKNYAVTLDLYVLIDNSSIELSTSVQDYVYDGKNHFVDVRVTNLASGFVYEYYMNPTSPVLNDDTTTPPYNLEELSLYYSTYDPDATNLGWKDVGVYYVYIKVSYPGGDYGDPVYRRLKFEITRKDLNLRLEDPFQVLDRPYDGKQFDNPVMNYADKQNNPIELQYKYYEAEKVDGQYRYIGSDLVYKTEPLNSRPFHAGKYKLIVSVKDQSANKNYTNPEVSYEFEITPKTLEITFLDGLPRSKNYNLQQWQTSILNNQINVDGLCDAFDVIESGTIKTISANAGSYSVNSDFEVSNLKIKHSVFGQYTQSDYNIKVLLDVVINEATINYKSDSVETDYDGLFHSISLKVFDPSTGYTIEYSTDNKNTWVEAKDFKGMKDVGLYTIHFKIKADNYAEVISQETLKINGLPANLDVQLPNPYTYTGTPYPGPTVNTTSRGTQTITYYTIGGVELATAPTDVGHYKVRVHIAAFEGFDENSTTREFQIVEKEVELTFDCLEFTYDGQYHYPLTASYKNVFDQTVTVNIDEFYKQIDHGEHPVLVTLSDPNYKATNPQVKFVINKKPVAVPDIDQNMKFTYRFTGTYLDGDNVEHEFEYGDKIIIKDSTGQYEYELDAQGNITGIYDTILKEWNRDVEDIPYRFIIDSNTNAGTRTLKIRMKSELSNNYAWDIEDETLRDKDVEIEYTIEKYVLSTKSEGNPVLLVLSLCDLSDVNVPADYYQIYADGEEIKLGVKAQLKNAEGYIIKTLKLTATNPELPEYKIVGYDNNTEISTPANKALIYVTGLNNFEFSEVVKFEITTQPPDTLQLKADSTVEFVRFEYISLTVVVEELEVIERTMPYQEHIFLGRVHQDLNTKAYIVSQFANEKVKIFSPAADGTYPAENELLNDSDPVGTNYLVVLYDDKDVEIDAITIILYGDIDGDGDISPLDVAQHININKEIRTISDGEANFYAALITRAELTPDPITLAALIKHLQYPEDPDCDFNNNFLTKR